MTTEKGKRNILCGTETVKHLKLDSYPSKALEAGIYPGMLLELSATGVSKHSTAGATDNPAVVFADKDVNDPDSTVEMAYDVDAGVYAFQLQPGEVANALVASGVTIDRFGVPLTSAGDGHLRPAEADDEVIVCYADELISSGAADRLVRVRVGQRGIAAGLYAGAQIIDYVANEDWPDA